MPYLKNRFTAFDEIWHSDAFRLSAPRQPVTFRDFKNTGWRTAAIVKHQKLAISPQPID